MQVADVMHTDVKTADAEDTFADVAKTMRTNGISSVVVLDGKKLAGIVTERDIVNLVAAGGDPHSVKVAHGMTRRDLETVGPKFDLADAAEHMVAAISAICPWSIEGRSSASSRSATSPVGRGRARGRRRDARHRPQPQGPAGGERTAEAAPQGGLEPPSGPAPGRTPLSHSARATNAEDARETGGCDRHQPGAPEEIERAMHAGAEPGPRQQHDDAHPEGPPRDAARAEAIPTTRAVTIATWLDGNDVPRARSWRRTASATRVIRPRPVDQ